MKFTLASVLVVGLAAQASASIFGSAKDAAYNKYHEKELERWLKDNGIPVPSPSDRQKLLSTVKENWQDNVVQPYNSWSPEQAQKYLSAKGVEVKKGTEKNKDSLIAQVKSTWYETEAQAGDAFGNVKNWIFDTWTESQLKAFADKNGIPVPQPRTRDSLLKVVRENFQAAADKIGESSQYPGDWIYENWSDSELKAWFDERGYATLPHPSNRDKLIAAIRKNSRQASLQASSLSASASSAAAGATQTLTDALLNSWSDSDLKAWFDKNDIKVPQGSKRNDLIALARKHSAKLTGDQASQKASNVYNAATTKAGNEFASANREAYLRGNSALDTVYSYVDWVKDQFGLLGEEAKASASSARIAASSSASSLSSVASKSSSSAASAASKSASKSGKVATDAATESASQVKNRVGEAAQKATDYVKEEL